MTPEAVQTEFSRILDLTRLGKEGEEHHLEATAQECAGLARRFDFVSLEGLRAEVTVRPSGKRGNIRLAGSFEAHVVQRSVVTQEPVSTHVKESFNWLFEPKGEEESGDSGDSGEELVLSSEMEEAEPLEGEELDMGECIAQYLSLALDPYPRLPDEQVPPELTEKLTGESTGQAETRESPFSVLQDLKNNN